MRDSGGVSIDSPVTGETPTYSAADLSAEGRLAGSRAMQRIFQMIKGNYVVEVELPAEMDKPRGWKLELGGPRADKLKDLQTVYPRKLLPCVAVAKRP